MYEEELTPAQTKERIVALLLVFAVVIFFWMAFHQNGLTMTFFARDYTAHEVTGLDRLGFSVWNLALLIVNRLCRFLTVPVQDRQGQIDFRRYCYLGSCGFRSQLWYYGPYIAYPSSDFPNSLTPFRCRSDSGITGRYSVHWQRKERTISSA